MMLMRVPMLVRMFVRMAMFVLMAMVVMVPVFVFVIMPVIMLMRVTVRLRMGVLVLVTRSRAILRRHHIHLGRANPPADYSARFNTGAHIERCGRFGEHRHRNAGIHHGAQ